MANEKKKNGIDYQVMNAGGYRGHAGSMDKNETEFSREQNTGSQNKK